MQFFNSVFGKVFIFLLSVLVCYFAVVLVLPHLYQMIIGALMWGLDILMKIRG